MKIYSLKGGYLNVFLLFFDMDINELQKEVLELFSKIPKTIPNRVEHTKQSALIHLMEEVGELARQVTNEHHRPEKFDRENLGVELADIFMYLVVLAKMYDVDLGREVKEGLNRIRKRLEEQ